MTKKVIGSGAGNDGSLSAGAPFQLERSAISDLSADPPFVKRRPAVSWVACPARPDHLGYVF